MTQNGRCICGPFPATRWLPSTRKSEAVRHSRMCYGDERDGPLELRVDIEFARRILH